jgi:CubicO group peptidase (beta-lactamase class C family)
MKANTRFTLHQIGALVTMAILAVWGVWVAWLHLTRPLGMAHIEVVFLSGLVPIYLILLPLYAFRVRWSYISGIVALLGLFADVTKSLVDRSLFFSLSPYNLTTVAVLLAGAGSVYFSLRSFLQRPSAGWIKSLLGIGGLLAVSALAVWQVSAHQTAIESYMLKRVIQGVQARTKDVRGLDAKIEALMAEGNVDSLAAAILVDDRVVWIQGYGQQPELDKPYDSGSVTKSFVATAVLQLYEQGQIDLDEDVNAYLPFSVRHPDFPDIPITFRMLLTHRSCLAHNTELYHAYIKGAELSQWGVANRGWEYRREFGLLSYPDFMAGYLDPDGPYYDPHTWAACQPGTAYVYSTPGFDLLGYLVEQVSGQSLGDYMHEHIFAPLEMTSTTLTPLDSRERMAVPHERWYGVLAKTNVELPLSQRRLVGGGGLYTTVGDLSNFLLAHMNEGTFGTYQLLQPETVALMHSKVSQDSSDFMGIGSGYGWSLYQEEPRQVWDMTLQPRGYQGHGGRYWGYSAGMYMVEETDGAYGYALLMNTSTVESSDDPWYFSIQANIQDLILQEAYRMYQEPDS